MRALLSQERAGHTETLGSFITILDELGYDVDICARNAYGYLDVYEKIGLRFRQVSEEEARDGVAGKSYDVVVFNSAHLTIFEEKGPFSVSLLRQLMGAGFNPRHIFRLHHSPNSARRSGDCSELATTRLLARFVKLVHTPYFPFPGHSPQRDGNICLCLLGGATPAALAHRDLDKMQRLFSIIETERLPIAVRWFCGEVTPEVKARFSRYANFQFRQSLNALEIVEEINGFRPIFATFFRPASKYHKSSLTGTVPFAVSIAAPLLMDAALADIYGLDEAVIVEKLDARAVIETLLSLQSDFERRQRRVREVREAKVLDNCRQFRAILASRHDGRS